MVTGCVSCALERRKLGIEDRLKNDLENLFGLMAAFFVHIARSANDKVGNDDKFSVNIVEIRAYLEFTDQESHELKRDSRKHLFIRALRKWYLNSYAFIESLIGAIWLEKRGNNSLEMQATISLQVNNNS
jgi:hypothetical protein